MKELRVCDVEVSDDLFRIRPLANDEVERGGLAGLRMVGLGCDFEVVGLRNRWTRRVGIFHVERKLDGEGRIAGWRDSEREHIVAGMGEARMNTIIARHALDVSP